jgi:alpha-L-rhamnosidase
MWPPMRKQVRRWWVVAAVLCGWGSIAGAAEPGALTVTRLRWDGRDQPLGFIRPEPRMSWVLASSERGEKQTAYQVLVASDPDRLLPGRADIWDSKKVVSSESINVGYGGPTPLGRQRAFWTVRVWDSRDRPSAFARPSWWEMALYDEEWEGQWVGRPSTGAAATATTTPASRGDRSVTYLRRSFALAAEVQRARLYASAFGVYEISINGKRAGQNVLAPGYTDYDKRVLFQTYDVTSLVRRGENVIGAVVAGGWCTIALAGRQGACGSEPPRVLVQLEVKLADGNLHTVTTDQSWKSHAGPTTEVHLRDGESYDARLEMPGWDTSGFDDRDWGPVQQYDKKTERDLVADPGTPIHLAEEVRSVKISEPRKGVHLFDLGQSITGWARLRTRARAGSTVTLRFGDGPDALRATDRYTARGDGLETWEPRFALRRFRYVEVSGLQGRPGPETITGRVVHSAMPATGQLETSHPGLDRLFASIVSAQRGAFVSVPTSAASEARGVGSMLEARAFGMTACLNRDVQTFYRKWIHDMRDAQHANAAYPEMAPLLTEREGGPGAGTAGILVPWALYRCYADRTPLDSHLASMGRFLGYLRQSNPDFMWTRGRGADLGDPLETGPPTDKALIATAELAYAAEALATMARTAGPSVEPEARQHQELARQAREAFVRRFVTAEGKLTSDTQTAYALAIELGLPSDEARARTAPHLVAAIERAGRNPTTGLLGSAHLLPALSRIGRDDLAYALLLQQRCPLWNCPTRNYAFGAVGEWMYDAIGGIALDPAAPAGRHVLVRPRPGPGLTFARARHESLYGPITTEWRRDRRSFRLNLGLPPNATATVVLPFPGRATEGGRPLEKAPGVKLLKAAAGKTEVEVQSGSYEFAVAIP